MKRPLRLTRRLFVTLCVVIVGLFFAYLVLRPSPSHASAEQYAVYAAYIELGLTGDSHDLGDKRGLLVIQASTTMSSRSVLFSSRHLRDTIPGLKPFLILEFFLSSLQEEQLERRFTLTARYELATQQEIDLYATEQFSRRFPDNYGYLTFSRIGFSRDLTEAVFYTEHACGMCGEGKYVFMRKVNGHWMIEGEAPTWIS
jgi:hypothetical protein